MFRTVEDFANTWKAETDSTRKVMRELTDASLAQRVSPGGRSLGRLAWHIALAPLEMLRQAGLQMHGLPDDAPVPATAAEIADVYESAAAQVTPAVSAAWSDEQMAGTIPMYGEQWTRGFVLWVLVAHQTHHRGQMTVLMRQAGLPVPGVYGPSREEWGTYGMAAQE